MHRRFGPGLIDLHCHWVAAIDDGARTVHEGAQILQALHALGFDHVVATPHMRPDLFDNSVEELRAAFRSTCAELPTQVTTLPRVSLGSEHFFMPEIVDRILAGMALPYRADDARAEVHPRSGGAVLVEFSDLSPLHIIESQLLRIRRAGYLPVIAHPERYPASWKSPELVERLQEAGCVALLDVCALVGKYGRQPQKVARGLLSAGVYHAACSDSHRPRDVELTEDAMGCIARDYGENELELLFKTGPSAILEGRRPATM